MNTKFFKATLISALTLTVLSICASQALAAPLRPLINAANREVIASKAAERKENNVDRLKAKADREIDRRIKSLNALLTRLNTAKHLTDADKSTLTSQINSEIAGLTTLKSKIDADSDIETLRTDVQSIVKDYRVYALIMPKANILISSDRILDLANLMDTIASKLQVALDSAKASGKDTTSMQSSLDDMKAKIADAKTQAQLANSTVANITPDQYNANHDILKPARTALQTARKDLETARKDAHTIYGDIKGNKLLQKPSTSSSSAAP